MSSHHDQDNQSKEAKPVAFRTPLILGLVTIFIVLIAVSTCDNKQGCCEDTEKCETSCESKHEERGVAEAHGTECAVADTTVKADTTAVKVEEHAHH